MKGFKFKRKISKQTQTTTYNEWHSNKQTKTSHIYPEKDVNNEKKKDSFSFF